MARRKNAPHIDDTLRRMSPPPAGIANLLQAETAAEAAVLRAQQEGTISAAAVAAIMAPLATLKATIAQAPSHVTQMMISATAAEAAALGAAREMTAEASASIGAALAVVRAEIDQMAKEGGAGSRVRSGSLPKKYNAYLLGKALLGCSPAQRRRLFGKWNEPQQKLAAQLIGCATAVGAVDPRLVAQAVRAMAGMPPSAQAAFLASLSDEVQKAVVATQTLSAIQRGSYTVAPPVPGAVTPPGGTGVIVRDPSGRGIRIVSAPPASFASDGGDGSYSPDYNPADPGDPGNVDWGD